MPRLVVPLLLLATLLLPAGTNAAAARSYDVLKLLERPLKAAKRGSDLSVLLPSRIPADFKRLFSLGRGSPGYYEFDIASAR
ncbi:MAG TPA: hypothetical protein VES79_12315, partial [Solirubrobacteraceae bacterium]|nr:hypothetical protein [Solirubrobacteraceae bacterium]